MSERSLLRLSEASSGLRKGQMIGQKVMNTSVGEPSESMGIDIPKG